MGSAKANTVRNLESVLNILVGLALTSAVLRLILNVDGEVDVEVVRAALPLFLTFLATMVPFYHGAVRHLDVTYVEDGGKEVRRPALLCDFGMLFVEGCLLVALANALGQPIILAWGLIALLGLDAIWGAVVQVALVKQPASRTELRWAALNTLAVLALVWVVLTGRVGAAGDWSNPLIYIALVRTAVDYAWCWDCYFPKE